MAMAREAVLTESTQVQQAFIAMLSDMCLDETER